MATTKLLKRGTCGNIRLEVADGHSRVVRDLAAARPGWRWLARHLARREARALRRLNGVAGIPELLAIRNHCLIRTFVHGRPMHEARPRERDYYRDALRLLRQVHCRQVVHNDLAKEANWICATDGSPALVDFQLGACYRRRSRLFRLLAREDLRHLMKHKATYCPETLTARQRRLLEQPSWATHCWRLLFKPPYRLVTRGLLGWRDRDGPAEREPRPD